MSESSQQYAQGDSGTLERILKALWSLESGVRSAGFSGWDPYDAMNSPYLSKLPGPLPKVAATQLMVYSPVNVRPLLRIRKGLNPKAIALFLSSYCRLRGAGLLTQDHFEAVAPWLTGALLASRSEEYSGYCWGFNFDWQDITRYAAKGLPTIVVTSFAANALLDLYELNRDPSLLLAARGACDFILNDLNVTESGEGVCFSYTPVDHHTVHNANLLGAALLARVHALTGEQRLLETSLRATEFSLSRQKKDGSWAYSVNVEDGSERRQIDFHQGFNICALLDIARYTQAHDDRIEKAVRKGAEFYRREQFDDTGRSLWRLPWRWPVDIHNQAQGVITFSRLGQNEIATRIALWTVHNMQDEDGLFCYHKYPLGANRIPYMRWGQAWMMNALSELAASLHSGGVGR